jgi:hypothetical protein
MTTRRKISVKVRHIKLYRPLLLLLLKQKQLSRM